MTINSQSGPGLTSRKLPVVVVTGAGESHRTLRPGELQPRLAAEGGVGGVVVHQEGELGLPEDGVRGAAQGDQLQQEPAVGPDVLLTV